MPRKAKRSAARAATPALRRNDPSEGLTASSSGKWHVMELGGHGEPTLRDVDRLADSDRDRYLLVDANLVAELAGRRFSDASAPGETRAGGRYSDVLGELRGRLGQLATAIVEMLRLAPTTEMGNPLAELIGPCWSTQQVERATGTTRQNLSDLARRDRAIRLRTADGTYWWPTFQFRRVGGVARFDVGSQRLWQVLPHGTFDDWDLAAWMLRPRHDLNGRRPVDLAVTEDAVEQSPLVDAIDDLVMRAER
jgi:hypothetical protein